MSAEAPLIALISATPAAIPPAVFGISQHLPDARVWNILDDRLLVDANEVGGLTPQLTERMNRLINHALIEGADGVLLTCSMYGPVARRFVSDVPILPPDDAAFSAVIDSGLPRVLMVASFENALLDAQARFTDASLERGATIDVVGTVAAPAFQAANSGDGPALLAALIAACEPLRTTVDAVLLAQYSLAPAATDLSAEIGLPVFSGPASAAEALRTRLGLAGTAT